MRTASLESWISNRRAATLERVQEGPSSGGSRAYMFHSESPIRRRSRQERRKTMTAIATSLNRGQLARWLNLLLGIWLFISAFVWDHTPAERTNTWILGVLCVVFALCAMSISTARWLNTALAVWLFISVWALPHRELATMWNN